MNTTLNIPVSIFHDNDTGFTYCTDSQFESSLYAPSVNTAKNKLRPLLVQEITDALTEHRNYQRRVLMCNDGTVLVVYFYAGGTDSMNWTNPFHGVQHLVAVPATHQVTIEAYKTFARAYVLALRSRSPFTPVAEKSFNTIEEAKQWAEERAEALI